MSIPQQFGVAAMVAELMRQNCETWSTFDDDDRLLRLLEVQPDSFLHAPTLTIEFRPQFDFDKKLGKFVNKQVLGSNTFAAHLPTSPPCLGCSPSLGRSISRVNVQVGDFMIPVEWRHVPARIKGLLGWVNEEEARIREGNGVGILELLIIHPHRDANGRVSRLFANLLLIRRGLNIITYLPAVPAQETQYYDALVAASSHNNPMPFINFVGKCIVFEQNSFGKE
ncbi:hypothetical protein niasHT_031046 [Heterodera trifolii]|uniref:Fido domain-containing protein n=1 Tax=Heterodera trifolii TaxID=157864 RepID=A0ABD2I224_9BILA